MGSSWCVVRWFEYEIRRPGSLTATPVVLTLCSVNERGADVSLSPGGPSTATPRCR